MLTETRRQPDRGASAILVAISMMLLMGVAAIAIDLGAGFNEKRQDQTAADLSAIAGALSLGDQQEMVAQVLSVARANLETAFTDSQWQAAWQACSDAGRTAAFVPLPEPASWGSGSLDCISLSPSFLRVRIPVQETETSFGKLLGVDSLSTDAYAVVSVFPPEGEGALPFALESGIPAGEVCLDSGTSGQALPPCDGSSQGSFGNIAPPLFGNPFLLTNAECDQQTSANNHVAESIAMGIDHLIWNYASNSWSGTGWSRTDNTSNSSALNSSVNMDLCNEVSGDSLTVAEPADGVLIDGVVVDTGNSVKEDVTTGLITPTTFIDGGQGRLWRTGNPVDVMSKNDVYELDNTPLWSHLLTDGYNLGGTTVSYNGAGGYAPASCNPALFGGALDADNTQMSLCLAEYETGAFTGQVFSETILDTPRFGAAPQLWHDNLGSGTSYRPVEQFRNVYLAGVWFDLKSHNDHEPFYPGQVAPWCPVTKGSSCAEIQEIEQLTAYLLVDYMLSYEVRTTYPGADLNGLEVTIYE